jgi:hypothetical protein
MLQCSPLDPCRQGVFPIAVRAELVPVPISIAKPAACVQFLSRAQGFAADAGLFSLILRAAFGVCFLC